MPVAVDIYEPAPLDSRADQVMVPMRDGVRLATDVYVGDNAGRLPAVLVRLPYDKCGRYTFMPQLSPCFNERGYAFVVQDVRGKFRSEGETVPFMHEIEDGYDTLEWIAAQPWSNGVVGMWGDSYFGYTQWAAVASGHRALKAISPGVTSVNLLDTFFWGGHDVPELYLAHYLATFWLDQLVYDFSVDWNSRPLACAFDEAFDRIGHRSAAVDRFLLGANGPLSIYPPGMHPFDRLTVPTLHRVGWFDNILQPAMKDYAALCARPDRAGLQYLLADAIDHENYHLRQYPLGPGDDHEKDDAALQKVLDYLTSDSLDFFDVVLRGRGRLDDMPRVKWFLGHDDWREAPSWPPPGTSEMTLYLSSPRLARSGPAGGGLSLQNEGSAGLVRWTHDPESLVQSSLVDPFSQIKEWPDEREIEKREDVLTFTSDRIAEHLDLAGPMSVTLRLASSAASMHIFAKLLDVAPDGSARCLARGQVRIVRPEIDRPELVSLSHTGYRVQAGHALRLHLASSDFPLYLPHPGTEENPWLTTSCVRNEQTLATGGSHPSSLQLTVLGSAAK